MVQNAVCVLRGTMCPLTQHHPTCGTCTPARRAAAMWRCHPPIDRGSSCVVRGGGRVVVLRTSTKHTRQRKTHNALRA